MGKEPAQCEYIMENRLCRAVEVQPEGKEIRREFCRNTPKNYCCYLCSDREMCDISCSYLDQQRKSASLDKDAQDEIDREISRYREEMTRLSVLLADGKIGEVSYTSATKTLEQKIKELNKVKKAHVYCLSVKNQAMRKSLKGEVSLEKDLHPCGI